MQVTDELRVLVEAEVARAIENFKKLSGGIEETEKKTATLGGALDSFSKKSLLITGAFGGAGIAAVKFAGENEKLKTSLEVLLGSAEKASSVFEEWKQFGASTPLSVQEIAGAGKSLLAFGVEAKDVTDTLRRLGDVSQGVGTSLDQVAQVYGKVKVQGKASALEIMQLQRQGIPVVQALAQALGTTESGIKGMVSAGKIGFPEIEKSFRILTENGGKFEGMMDKLSQTTMGKFSTATDNAKQALASFGEVMLPVAADLLDSASSILQGITGMDEGTKRFVIGMGGVVAVSGPAITAIKGVGAAMAVVAANPYLLAIGGTIVAAGIIVGIINKQAHAYQDLNTNIRKTKTAADGLLSSYAGGNNAKLLDKETTEELIRLYPNLSGEIKAYSTTVEEATKKIKENTEAEILNAATKQTELLKRQISAANDAENFYRNEAATTVGRGREFLAVYQHTWEVAEEKARKTRREINAELAKIGKTLGDDFAIIDLPVNVVIPEPAAVGTLNASVIKKWQEWYGEITKIDPASFGDSGAQAAELYLAEFSRSFEAGKTVFAALGEEFDIAGSLRGQQAEIQKALIELFSINPADIDQGFTAIDESIRPLIDAYQSLIPEIKAADEAMKSAAAQKEYAQKIEGLKQKIADFGKSEVELAYDTAIANKASIEQAAEIARLTGEFQRVEIIAEYNRQIDELTMSQNELAMAAYAATGATEAELAAFKATLNLSDEIQQAQRLKETIEGIKESLSNLGTNVTLGGIETLGKALGQGASAGDAMKAALTAMSQEILNALPNMFLQAGLQLIAQGQWALGLGFIAAAGSTALVKGYVSGRIEAEQSAARNAHGNIFNSDGIQAFARGGTFTNQIVQTPTLFRFARGTGLMGEAGPEAIMPLKRMANGDLGVRTEGGGANVTVTIINNSGAEVHQEESDDGNGNKDVRVIIGDLVNGHIASGKADRVMGGRYGLRAAGV
ncbi:MAG: tape measure protein [Treponema sp.]|jgi:lambda family phage tail tape measure protein|nr:tape measure protein [Treponema sp.]